MKKSRDYKRILPIGLAEKFKGVYTLRINLHGAGFGAMLLQTLNQIRYCERMDLLPVVNYDESCNSHFFDSSFGNNMWAQYFEPVVPPHDYASIRSLCESPKHPLTTSSLQNLDDEQMLRISEGHEDSIYTYPFADWRINPPDDLADWYKKQRAKGHATFTKYIRVKPNILSLINQFWDKHFTACDVLGIHIRGTDLNYAPPVSPAEYFEHVDIWLASHPKGKLFIATEQSQYLSIFQARYGDRVSAYESCRSENDIVPFNFTSVSPYKKGEDVLVDMFLLSKTDFLIKGASAVGELAMYINPKLQCLDLSLCKRFAFGQDYGEGWNGASLKQTLTAWQLIKGTDMTKVAGNVKTQTGWQAILYRYRPLYSPATLFLQKLFNALARRLKRHNNMRKRGCK
jgi:hypothetical protein